MNKLASIFYIMQQGLPTIDITILPFKNPEETLAKVYRDVERGWAVRSGKKPNYNEEREKSMPWGVGKTFDEVLITVQRVRKLIREEDYIFVHPQRGLEKVGNMLSTPEKVIVEGILANGDVSKLTDLMRGRKNPDEIIIYNPGMIGVKSRKGKKVFTIEELLQLREVERKLEGDANYLTGVEFSITQGKLDIHDLYMRLNSA